MNRSAYASSVQTQNHFNSLKFNSGVSAIRAAIVAPAAAALVGADSGNARHTTFDLAAWESAGAACGEKCATIPDLRLITAAQQISLETAAFVSQNEGGSGAKDGARTRDLRRDRATL